MATTDEVWRLQRGSDPECVFFQEMAEHGHYGGRPGASRQGIYVCAPGGTFLASINSNRPDRVLETMRQGLAAWGKLPAEKRKLTDNALINPEHRWEDSYPAEGLVLSMYSRDLPTNCDPNQPCESKWNQDRVWFSKAEARQWLPAEISLNATHQLPEALLSRLARFHLVDTVKGQSSIFSSRNLENSQISTEVDKIDGDLVSIVISGATTASSSRSGRATLPHGVKTRLLGRATYDLKQDRFTEYEFVAVGNRWGMTTFNGRRRDGPQGPLGYVFRLSTPEEPRVAPAFISNYDAEWVKTPLGKGSRRN